MPFDGSGNFNRVMNWVNDSLAHIKILSARHDQEDDNFAAGLSNTLTKDGQSQPTANIPMNGKKLVNLAPPTNPTDAATKGYADSIRTFSTGTTLTGASTGSTPNFVSTAFMGFTEVDMSIVARKADPAATPPTINRIVINDRADGTGSDIFAFPEDGVTRAVTLLTTVGAGTYTKKAGLKYLMVELQAGGGGGGGAGGTGATTYSAGGGGGGGGYVRYLYRASDLAATTSYSIGAAGAVSGGAGGDTTFKLLTANGGGGGANGVASAVTAATSGGAAGAASSTETGTAITIVGGSGGHGYVVYPVAAWNQRGHGGVSFMTTFTPVQGTGTAAGIIGKTYGGGGVGASNGVSQTFNNGGAGGQGCIILTEFFGS